MNENKTLNIHAFINEMTNDWMHIEKKVLNWLGLINFGMTSILLSLALIMIILNNVLSFEPATE